VASDSEVRLLIVLFELSHYAAALSFSSIFGDIIVYRSYYTPQLYEPILSEAYYDTITKMHDRRRVMLLIGITPPIQNAN
jgi:hypothetical protein